MIAAAILAISEASQDADSLLAIQAPHLGLTLLECNPKNLQRYQQFLL
jgi:hypothetical protein